MAIKSNISVVVNVNNINYLVNIVARTVVMVNGQWLECAFVNVPEIGYVWLDNSYFVTWA
jgi:hypothetical protein